jgi:hypothetical protein
MNLRPFGDQVRAALALFVAVLAAAQIGLAIASEVRGIVSGESASWLCRAAFSAALRERVRAQPLTARETSR